MTFLSSKRIPQRTRLQFRTKYSFKLGNESHFFSSHHEILQKIHKTSLIHSK